MPKKPAKTQEQLVNENEDLRARLDEAEETLRAIRSGEVDALIVSGEGGEQVFTLKGARELLAEANQSRLVLLSVIEDQKQAEDAVRQSETRHRVLVEQAADGIFITDEQGHYLDVNASGCAMLGYAREEILGADFTLILLPQDVAQDSPKLDRLHDGKILLRERRYKRKDGTVFPVEISAKMLSDGRIQSIVRDVTERKRAEEEIQKRSKQLEALHQISLDLSAELNLHTLLQSIVEKAIPLIHAATCSCYLLRQDRQELERIALAGGERLPTGQLTRKRGEGLIGKVWERNTPIVVDDYSKWENARSVYPNGPSRAVMGVPIRWGEKFLGVLILTAELPRHFSKSDIEILTFFADQAAVAIQNARLFDETHRRAKEFEVLYETARDLSLQLDHTTLLQSIAERAARLLHATRGSIHFYHAAQQELEFAISSDPATTVGNRLKLGEGLVGKAAESRKTIIVDHYSQWEHRSLHSSYIGMESAIGAPMIYNGKLIGVITVGELAPTDRKFTASEAQLVSLFASHAASAIHNARLVEETQHRAEQLSTLNEISKTVSAQLQLEGVLETIFQQVKRILPLDAFYVALYDANKHEISYPLFYDEGKRYDEMSGPPDESTQLFQTIKTGEPKLVNHTPEEFESPRSPDTMLGNRSKPSASLMWLPLKSGTHIIGALSAQSYTLNAYTAEHLTLLNGIANQVAIAIENARLHRETERSLARVDALHQIDRAISSSLDLTVTMNTFLTHATVQLGVDAADILRLDQNTHMLEFVAGTGFRTQALQHTHLQLGDGLAGKAALERKTIAVSDLPGEIDGLARSPSIQSEGFAAYYAVPLIAKGRVNGVMEIFHRTTTDNDKSWLDFLTTLAEQAAIALDNTELYQNLQRANTDLGLAYDATILGWSNALDLRDHETQGHTLRVTEMTLRLGRAMGINEAELIHLRRGALLHDIGKMGVPDEILHKPGALTDLEWQVMRQHPDLAYRLLSPIEYLRPALDIPYCHHEKWDGTGYPRGLKGEQIPFSARLFAVVDVWDALRSDRPYRKAWDEEKVRAHILAGSGTHFDPKVVEKFLDLLSEDKDGS